MASLARLVDAMVGKRIRKRRTELGLTQEHLAAALKISYQQIQKYETGTNRVSAGRLYHIGQKLGVDVAYFFKDVDESIEDGKVEPLAHGGTNRSTIEIARNFNELTDPSVRSAISGLIKTLVHADN